MQPKLYLQIVLILFTMFMSVSDSYSFGQVKTLQKKTATVGDFTYDALNAGMNKEMSLLASKIMNHLNGTKNLKMLERKDFKTIVEEKELQKKDEFMYGKIVKQGR